MSQPVHPSKALFVGEKPFPVIPSCEHFAGSEKLIGKALELQEKLGPVFDITCDCEDGAPAGHGMHRRVRGTRTSPTQSDVRCEGVDNMIAHP